MDSSKAMWVRGGTAQTLVIHAGDKGIPKDEAEVEGKEGLKCNREGLKSEA